MIVIRTLTPNSAFLLPHHVGVGTARHALAGVEVEEFVDLRGGQSISDLQLLHDEHLPGERLLTARAGTRCRWARALAILPSYCHWIGLVLERHLRKRRDMSRRHVRRGGQCFFKVRRVAQFSGDFMETFEKVLTAGHMSLLRHLFY